MNRRVESKSKVSLLDRRILNRLQEDISFVQRPWEVVAGELGISENLLLKRVSFLKKQGIIRRISAIFAPAKIKYASTLVAVKTKPGKSDIVAKRINVYPEVTHNYRRDAEYNIWFTLIARNRKRIFLIISRLKKVKDIQRIAEFPAEKIFKINVKLAA